GDHNAVIEADVLIDGSGNDLPFLRLDVGAVQSEDLLGGDVVVGRRRAHMGQNGVGAGGGQALFRRKGGNGAAGGEHQNLLHGTFSAKKRSLLSLFLIISIKGSKTGKTK